MPIFEYRCVRCGLTFERLVRAGGEEIECPDCAGGDVVRLLSAASTPKAGAATLSRDGGGGDCCGGGCGCSH